MTGASSSPTIDREITITRIFDAPRDLVFDAFTDPAHIVEWWGPDGFTTTTIEADIRPGGVWRFVMHGPDGVDYPNHITYVEIVRPERIAYDHGGDSDANGFQVVATFAALAPARTELTLHSTFASPAEREQAVAEYGAIEGGKQMLERLAAHLAAQAHA